MGGPALNIAPDTNVLLRAAVPDHPEQTFRARAILENATLVALTPVSLCEFAWVLRSTYKQSPAQIAYSIRTLLARNGVQTDDAAAQAGLAFLDAGGDFADGVIAHSGAQLGGTTFVSFDRRAVAIAGSLGLAATGP